MKTFDLNSSHIVLEKYLEEKNMLTSEERIIDVSKPGEGNMNVVLRITTNKKSIVLKQSRPFVQKYNQIPAPLNRISVENEFYKAAAQKKTEKHMPLILGYDAENYILLLQDLGNCDDMTYIYQTRSIENHQLEKIVNILNVFHNTEEITNFPVNMEMRKLNHQHIFVLPFLENNGFQLDDIQSGLQDLSLPFKRDLELKKIVDEIGQKYLSEGNILLHGDFYPGSWITIENQVFVIDPEFSFVGFAEFDLGVMIAHILMATMKIEYRSQILKLYTGKADEKLTRQIAGIEIMRRLIGLAQLPLDLTIEEKEYLLQTAYEMIRS